MKYKYKVAALLLVMILLTGCAAKSDPAPTFTLPPVPVTTDPPETVAPTTPPETQPTEPAATQPTEPPTEATLPETEPETEPEKAPSPTGLYLVRVPDGGWPIHSAPGYDSPCTGSIDSAGTFTIMEEAYAEGGVWGRLKSGVGWINVSELQKQYLKTPLLTVDHATNAFVSDGEYECIYADNTEYTFPFVFTAGKELRNVQLWETVFEDMGNTPTHCVGTISVLKPERPLLVWGSFPTDFSAYYITFEDTDGRTYSTYVYMSGLDGSLTMDIFY